MRGLIPILLCLLIPGLAAADTAVVHPGVAITALDRDLLSDLFLGERTTWEGGQRVVVVLQRRGGSAERLASLLGKTPAQVLATWKRLVFTGNGVMPQLVEDDNEVVSLVARTPGAIGWVEEGKATGQVKAVGLP